MMRSRKRKPKVTRRYMPDNEAQVAALRELLVKNAAGRSGGVNRK